MHGSVAVSLLSPPREVLFHTLMQGLLCMEDCVSWLTSSLMESCVYLGELMFVLVLLRKVYLCPKTSFNSGERDFHFE